MIKVYSNNDSEIFFERNDEKIETLVPFPNDKIEFKNKINFGKFYRKIINSKMLEQYHEYYGYALRNKSLFKECREWNDSIISTKKTNYKMIIAYWKTIKDDQFIDFIPKLNPIKIENSKKLIGNLEEIDYEKLEFSEFKIDEDTALNNFKKRFKVKNLLTLIFKNIS